MVSLPYMRVYRIIMCKINKKHIYIIHTCKEGLVISELALYASHASPPSFINDDITTLYVLFLSMGVPYSMAATMRCCAFWLGFMVTEKPVRKFKQMVVFIFLLLYIYLFLLLFLYIYFSYFLIYIYTYHEKNEEKSQRDEGMIQFAVQYHAKGRYPII